MEIAHFQKLIAEIYGAKDQARGLDKTFVWFVEEVGELARALHRGRNDEMAEEFADCLAWLLTLANLCNIDVEQAIGKYANGCNKCHFRPCRCSES